MNSENFQKSSSKSTLSKTTSSRRKRLCHNAKKTVIPAFQTVSLLEKKRHSREGGNLPVRQAGPGRKPSFKIMFKAWISAFAGMTSHCDTAFFAGMTVFCFLLISGDVWSGQKARAQREIKHKSRDLEKVQQDLKKKRFERAKIEEESREIAEGLRKNNSKIEDVEKTMIFTHARNREIKQNLALSTLDRESLEGEIYENQADMEKTVSMLYVSARLMGPQSVLPSYTRQMIRSQANRINRIKTKKKKVDQDWNSLTTSYDIFSRELTKQRSTLVHLRSGINEGKKKLEKNKTRQETVKTELNELKHTAQELAGLIDILRSKAKIEIESEKKDRLKKEASGISPIASHSLPWPVKGSVVQKFGRQKHPELGTPYISNGLLIRLREPKPVQVVADGNVLFSGEFMSYGPMVIVEHPGDWFTVYGNMEKWVVEKGQKVKKGDLMGSSGIDEKGRHMVYFELRFYGKPTNPVPWLSKIP